MRGGQVSIEYLLIVGFSFFLVIPLLILFQTQSVNVRADLSEAQANTAGQAIVESASRVYYAGPPARETIEVNLPNGVDFVSLRNRSVYFVMREPGNYDLLVPSEAPLLIVDLPGTPGPMRLRVEATALGVRVTEE